MSEDAYTAGGDASIVRLISCQQWALGARGVTRHLSRCDKLQSSPPFLGDQHGVHVRAPVTLQPSDARTVLPVQVIRECDTLASSAERSCRNGIQDPPDRSTRPVAQAKTGKLELPLPFTQ